MSPAGHLTLVPYLLLLLAWVAVVQSTNTDLATASWIWLPGANYTSTTAAFLRTFSSPPSKSAVSAHITISCDANYTLWVNGQAIGATPPSLAGPDAWRSAQRYDAALNASSNVFAVLGMAQSGDTAGLVAAIRVVYGDGSNDTLVSDGSWSVASGTPAKSDFPLPELGIAVSGFDSAQTETINGGVAEVVVDPASSLTQDLLAGSNWIWATSNASANASVGSVGFRKTAQTPPGKKLVSVSLLATADNTFELYIDNELVATPPVDPNSILALPGWGYAQRVTADLSSSSPTTVFDFLATNFAADSGGGGPSPAGLVAVLFIEYADGSNTTVRTDASWLAASVPSGSPITSFLAMTDGELKPADVAASYGALPWGPLPDVADALDLRRLVADGSLSESGMATGSGTVPGPVGTGAATRRGRFNVWLLGLLAAASWTVAGLYE